MRVIYAYVSNVSMCCVVLTCCLHLLFTVEARHSTAAASFVLSGLRRQNVIIEATHTICVCCENNIEYNNNKVVVQLY